MPARLHRELIGTSPKRWLLMTHGIYGSGANWRGIARKLHEQRPEWGVVLVDLRQHGRSEPGDPPHTLAACAADLRAVLDELPGIEVIAGHSFGGKVVLQTRAIAPPWLRQAWVLDASPSARPGAERDPDNSVMRVLELMERLPRTWAKRDDFIAAVTAAGEAPPLAQWLAMNVVPRDDGDRGDGGDSGDGGDGGDSGDGGDGGDGGNGGGGELALRLDLAAVRTMLRDYYAQDLWPVAFDPTLPGELHVVIAERAATISDDDRARMATAPPHVHVHRVDAGHWLHIEAAATVVDLLARALPTSLS